MKITADTNFFISATQWDTSVAYKLLIILIKSNSEIFTTKDILDEFSKVLKRDFRYNQKEIDKIIEILLIFVKMVEPINKINIIKDDPDDNKILECAIVSKSQYIVTYDKHLLKIKSYGDIKILKPEDVLKLL